MCCTSRGFRSRSCRCHVVALIAITFGGTACAPGHRVSSSELTFSHPSVRWLWRVERRIGFEHYLLLPGAVYPTTFPGRILEATRDEERVTVRIQSGSGSCSGWPRESAQYLVDLDADTGRVIEWRRTKWRPEQWENAEIPDRSEDCSVWSEAADVYLTRKSKPGQSPVRLLSFRKGASPPSGEWNFVGSSDRRGSFVIRSNYDYVLCIDPGEFPD